MLQGRHIILGITGSIAAYKAASLVRLLVRDGAEVKVILTPYAREFITPVTLATLSRNTVLMDFFHHDDGAWNSHVDLGIWADLMVIAPASANTMAKMAWGICDNLLLTTYLSARCPVMIAPAMDLDMFSHPATKANLGLLKSRGHLVVEPAEGELASGLIGKGRMEEPEGILQKIRAFFGETHDFSGQHWMVTAGPTVEPIDPVRFISNYSSGRMGYALALELANRGAMVSLVSGPVEQVLNHPSVKIIPVKTSREMSAECHRIFPDCQGAILAAAVADYEPAQASESKIKRTGEKLFLELQPTQDIAASLGKTKKSGQILAGFALETHEEVSHAWEKLHRKNFDLIVLNSLNDPGAGFGTTTNQVTILQPSAEPILISLRPKNEVAVSICNALAQLSQSQAKP